MKARGEHNHVVLCSFMLDLFFDAEDAGDLFLRNVGFPSLGYKAVYPRRQYSSVLSNSLSKTLERICLMCEIYIEIVKKDAPT
jgi:hypothetical protein